VQLPPDRGPRFGFLAASLVLAGAALAALAHTTLAESDGDRRSERAAMVEQQIVTRGVTERRLLSALLSVPRHRFVPAAWQAQAYADSPLPIGEGQTISQPYIVAKMTELAALRPTDRVFELGTGSGYQAAVASRLCAHVYSVEIQPVLAERAAKLLRELHYDNVSVRTGDGFRGWPEKAPFDAMLITAAVPEIPEDLLRQLKPGGRAVLPVGPPFGIQDLLLVEKGADGKTVTRQIFPVRFVPATGKQ
jgi:protein-L-isoaspartate(D-aspartate) O-methyltransferase